MCPPRPRDAWYGLAVNGAARAGATKGGTMEEAIKITLMLVLLGCAYLAGRE